MKRYPLALAFCLIGATLLAAAPAPRVFRAGAATSNITPFLGGGIVGGFVAIPSTNIHDPLHARCLVLDDGRTRLALVVCDLLGIGKPLNDGARKRIQQATGIAPENVMISAVHTHSALSTGHRDGLQYPEGLENYGQWVEQRIADGVRCALNQLRPAQLAFVTAEAPEHVSNRRWFMKPGTTRPNPFGGQDQVQTNPASGSPNLLKPAGPTDPTVSVLALREPDGRPLAVFSAYSLHYVGNVARGDISADYYGAYCAELARLLRAQDQDPPFVAMMANGTSGDVNNLSFLQPRKPKKPYEQIRYVAHDLAAKVHAALAKAVYRADVTLAARYRELPVAVRQPTAEQIAWAKQIRTKPAPKPGQTDLPYSYSGRILGMAGKAEPVVMPLQVLRIGDVCLGTMPVEIFCEIGLEFKQRSPVRPAFLVSLANGGFGYLPSARHFELGGYETWLGSSRLETHASEKLLDALLQMAAETHSAAAK